MSSLVTRPARASGEFAIGGDLPVVRLGYGTMQLPGPGVWGEPRDHDEVIRVLRRALDLGVTFIDTADSYGPEVSERLIREALYPHPDDLVIATKAGLTRSGPGRWGPNGQPEYLKAQAEKSLRLLGLERIEPHPVPRPSPGAARRHHFPLRACLAHLKQPRALVLFRDGDPTYDLIVLLEGEVRITEHYLQPDEFVIATYGPGEFLGEIGLLTGQRAYLTAAVSAPGRILRIPGRSRCLRGLTRTRSGSRAARWLARGPSSSPPVPATTAYRWTASRTSRESVCVTPRPRWRPRRVASDRWSLWVGATRRVRLRCSSPARARRSTSLSAVRRLRAPCRAT